MTVASASPRYGHYTSAGSVGPYSFAYQILSADEIEVRVAGSVVTNYTLTGISDEDGGTFTFLTAPVSGAVIFHRGLTDITQQTDYDSFTGLPFTAAGHEAALDKLTLLVQEIDGEKLSRVPQLPIYALASQRNKLLPLGAVSRLLGYDALGDWTTYTLGAAPDNAQFDHLGNYGNSLATAVASIGASARLLFVLVPTTVSANVIVPSNITLVVLQSGLITVNTGITLTIQGGLVAGFYQLFTGAGTVLGTPRIPCAVAEWFGALGDGTTYDDEAWQKTVNFFPRVQGRRGATYLMNVFRQQFTAYDLHRRGRLALPTFDLGYWCAVKLPTGAVVEDATFVMNVAADDTEKKAHCFAFGDPTSVTRFRNVAIRRCHFSRAAASPNITSDWNCYLGQSTDFFHFEQNTFDDNTLGLVEVAGQFGWLFDCHHSQCVDNYGIRIHVFFSHEYCNNVLVAFNKAWEGQQICDMDKIVTNVVIANNTFDRSAIDTVGLDAVFETNGTKNVVIIGNMVNRASKGVTYSVKEGMVLTWAEVLAGAGTVETVTWDNCVQKGNVWANLNKYGVLAGTDWVSGVPHPGVAAGNKLVIHDIFNDCGQALVTGSDQAIIMLYEGTNIDLHVEILGSAAHGVYAQSFIDADAAGATADSNLEIVSFTGSIEGCAEEGVFINKPKYLALGDLFLRNNGASAATPAQLTLRRLEARTALIRGSVCAIKTTGTVTYGVFFSAQNMAAGQFTVELDGARATGHNTADLAIIGDGTIERLDNFFLNACHFPTTTINAAAALTLARERVVWGTAAPSANSGDDVGLAIGTRIMRTTPAPGAPHAWVQTTAGSSTVTGRQASLGALAGAITRITDLTLTKAENGNVYKNQGAVATMTFTLPPALEGMSFGFWRTTAQQVRADPDGTETIRDGTAGQYARLDTNGGNLFLHCLVDGEWEVLHSRGTITMV